MFEIFKKRSSQKENYSQMMKEKSEELHADKKDQETKKEVTKDIVVAGKYDFKMIVEDVFTISGRGTVATGCVDRGTLKINDEVKIVSNTETKKAVVSGIEMFRKQTNVAATGDNVGILLRGTSVKEVQKGDILIK